VRRFEASAASAADQLAFAAEGAGARAAHAYLDVIRLRTLIAIAGDNEQRHRETLAQVSRLADVGKGRRADAQQAEARYALAQASLTQLRAQLTQAEAAYLQLTGQPPGKLADVGRFAHALPATLAAALEQALQHHPTVRAAQKDLLAAQAERDALHSRYASPRLALEVGTSANHNLDGVQGAYGDRYAMLRLRYNLFRGGSDDARVREAEARVDAAFASYGEREMREAWEALVHDRIRLPQLQRYAAASAQVVDAYRLQFSIGQRTLLDVLNAENESFAARSSEYTGSYLVTVGELRVLAAMGKLLETLGVRIDAVPPALPPQQERRAIAVDETSGPGSATPETIDGEIAPERERRDAAVALNLRMATALESAGARQ
jgi:adhesin transport system outer membrane protein